MKYCRTINCELEGKPHQWLHEKVYGEWDFYGLGIMELRRCEVCQTIEYIEFMSEDGYVTEIITVLDEEFEKLCEALKNPKPRNEAFVNAQKEFRKKYRDK